MSVKSDEESEAYKLGPGSGPGIVKHVLLFSIPVFNLWTADAPLNGPVHGLAK
ncbi:hypothetical protein DPMN_068440 [Dreissena polymorpha]|uniref:Uncharacterized protein n=1 Tax=Dreissena polymorpha TaxID=45954 RepID=A0A9D4BTL8_DREPO|nr:hypothetical protein DPMN_068440 [Dreissena polymorpha]